ncbi:MAG: Bifunctional dehydrogenase and ferrochelatase [Cirrosporium novae-zelandiae]|nr:MAG: Bifunctional dehydrogenase and ferrochelatase [Cirrosporium novae-zelandiae]
MSTNFPEIQRGGSLILAYQIKDKHVLVIGGGDVAAGRILNALNADAKVTVIAPSSGLNPEVAFRVSQNQISHIDRKFEPSDLNNEPIHMALCAIDDPEVSSQIWKLCKEKRIPANIADVPSECDFFFGSVYRNGPLQIMVSTNGNGPKMASMVRKQIAKKLPRRIGTAITKVGMLRQRLRKAAPGPKEGKKRMRWMAQVCESWSLDELIDMNEKDMDALLGFYETGAIPSFAQILDQPYVNGVSYQKKDISTNLETFNSINKP